MFGTNLEIEQGLEVRKMESWSHYTPQDGWNLPRVAHFLKAVLWSLWRQLWRWLMAWETCFSGWLPRAGLWDICKWQCSIFFLQKVSLPNDDIPFGNTKPALFINVSLLPVAMLDALDHDAEALVLFFQLSPVLDDCLHGIGKCWFHIFSFYLKMRACIGKLHLSLSLAGPYYSPLYLSPTYFNSTNILSSNLHSNGTPLCHLFSVVN